MKKSVLFVRCLLSIVLCFSLLPLFCACEERMYWPGFVENTEEVTKPGTGSNGDNGSGAGSEAENNYLELTSVRFVDKMGVGWNLGNTLESNLVGYPDNDYGNNIVKELAFESRELFCEVRNHQDIYRGKTTLNTIRTVYDKGFRTVRIPVSWSNHMDTEGKINKVWMDRVQEVVDYVMEFDDMFAIINIMDTPNINAYGLDDGSYDKTMNLLENVWTQVAETFADYDGRLIFENLNEPLHSVKKWELSPLEAPDIYDECNRNLMSANQSFVNIVRAQGSEYNANRFLTVSAYGNIGYYVYDETINNISQFSLPTDSAQDKLLVNIHSYHPNAFSYGNESDWSEEADQQSDSGIAAQMSAIGKNLVQKGIGVVMSEWGSVYKDIAGREDVRIRHAAYYMECATKNGICAIVWDNNNRSTAWGTEYFGLLNRYKASGLYETKPSLSGVQYDDSVLWFSEDVVDAIFEGYSNGKQ